MVTEVQARVFLKEAQYSVRRSLGKIWGFQPLGDASVIFIGAKLSPEKRTSLLKKCQSFVGVFFLTGLSHRSYKNDPTLVQRVLMYEGSLPNWEWARGAGEWKKSLSECK